MVKGGVLVSPKVFISFILVIIIICIILVIVQPGNNIGKKDKGPELAPNYFNRPGSWGATEGKSVIVKNGAGETKPLSGTSICSLYTYENEFDIEIKPSLVNLFQDYYNGLVHQSSGENLVCLEANEILAYNGVHTCDSKIPNSCIDFYGNYVNFGLSEQYPVNCRNNLPTCPGAIYSISCNFQLSFTGSLDISSKFISINTVEVNNKDYDKFVEEKNYYIDQGYFSKNEGLSAGVYKPVFFNDMYKSSSARQQFKFIRYIYDSDKKSWAISENGPFAAIIFKPANAYLTADENFEFILKTLENIDYNSDPEPIIQWLMLPPMDLGPAKFTIETKYSKGNIKNLSSAATVYGPIPDDPGPDVYFDPRIMFPPYNNVNVNDIVVPMNTNVLSFKYDGDKNSTRPDTSKKYNYPDFVLRAIQGGEASEQADFFTMDLVAKLTKNPLPNHDNSSETIALNEVTTRILEPKRGTLKPPLDADYLVVTATETSTSLGDFNKGNLIIDNQVVWESIDPREELVAFDPNYFVISSSDTVASEISLNNKGGLAYQKENKGLVVKINADEVSYSFTAFSPNSYQVILNKENCTGLDNIDENPNTNAIISLIFESSRDTNGNPVTALADIIVLENGTSYANNTVFGIRSSAFPGVSTDTGNVNNLKLLTQDQQIIYSSISLDINNNPFNPNFDKASDFKNGGMIIPEKDIVINNNGDFSLSNNSIKLDATVGGEGYSVGDVIYINQTDQFGNSLFGAPFNVSNINKDNMEKLASITIKSTQSSPVGISFPAKTSLIRTNPPASHPGLARDNITYNFNDNSPGKYDLSPPQIAFVGNGLLDELKESIKEGSASEITSYFASSKKGGAGNLFTDIEFIKTIQFTELNYIGYSPDPNVNSNNAVIQDIENNNSLGVNAQPVLGRFIPYTQFRPPTYNQVPSPSDPYNFVDEQFPTKEGPTIFYNNNYTQLVPYGLKNIYNKFIEQQNLASL